MNFSRAVLIPIDMQCAFDEASWPRRNNPEVDKNSLALLAAYRKARRPILHVRHDSVAPNSTLRPGAPGHAFRPGFEPLPGEMLITKTVNAAFIGTTLDATLHALRDDPNIGVEAVVVFGISTDMCVSTSVRVGANLGWPMVVVGDACACFDLPRTDGQGMITAEDVHATHLATLAFEFAKVVTTADILRAVSSRP